MPDKNENDIAYEYLRDEIKREDSILFGRMSASLTFQGFLITATAFIVSNKWENTSDILSTIYKVQHFKLYLLIGIGILGILVSLATVLGINAAKESIKQTIDWWKNRKQFTDCKDNYPSAYGEGVPYRDGHAFTRLMSISFFLMWVGYLAAIINIFVVFTI